MYICPTCKREFDTSVKVAAHMLICWRELHPDHRSNEAPHSEDIVTRSVSDDIAAFFGGFNARSNG